MDPIKMTRGKEPPWRGTLVLKGKTIQSLECSAPPIRLPIELHMEHCFKASIQKETAEFDAFELFAIGTSPYQVREWKSMTSYMYESNKMAQVYIEGWELLMLPPKVAPTGGQSLHVCYRPSTHLPTHHDLYIPRHLQPGRTMPVLPGFPITATGVDDQSQQTHNNKVPRVARKATIRPRGMCVHPGYLDTLKHTHAAWIFGGIAELIDNAQDAKASCLDISVEEMLLDGSKTIPV